MEICAPQTCRHCAYGLGESDNEGKPRRHQVTDFPEEMRSKTAEYRLQSRKCPGCKKTTAATLPAGVPESNFGPNLEAFIALLMARYRISKRDVPDLIRVITGIEISTGAVCNLQERVAEALDIPAEEVLAALRGSTVVHQDETSWRECNE